MYLKEEIKNDMKEALRKKESERLSALKMLLSSITNEEIKLKKKEEGLTREETLKVIKSETKKRKDSIEAYTKAERSDLAEKEMGECRVLEVYLPDEIPDKEIKEIVEKAIKTTGADSIEDFGKVMKETMNKVKGQADGNRVSEIVKKLLNT